MNILKKIQINMEYIVLALVACSLLYSFVMNINIEMGYLIRCILGILFLGTSIINRNINSTILDIISKTSGLLIIISCYFI
ncbi:hypothetical protein [Faecalimicrobium dakarense]|uniref:hypothetical protein n=1 Tax=Faecalimicrobium dakarense TaxID=1301100 RepID=UPI0005A62145|nr:hypothetical protein [[Clostridium] dakarense]